MNVRPANKKPRIKVAGEKNETFISKGTIISERTSEAAKAMIDIKIMKETYAL